MTPALSLDRRRRGFRGLGQPTTPLPPAPGGFCPTLPTACPSGSVLTTDAAGCPNYPCSSTASTSTSATSTAISSLTSPVTFLGMSVPLWGVLAALGVGGVLLFGGKK